MKPAVILFIVALLFVLSTPVHARIWYVPSECPTIQAGIDSAGAGDIVQVANGTYTGSHNKNLDFKAKAITVRSEHGPDNCTIDCQSSGLGFNFQGGETHESIVDGFTIRNGQSGYAGGINCDSGSSPTITNCIMSSCITNRGGGVNCEESSSPTITNCIIVENHAGHGGGVCCTWGSNPTITNCIIKGNQAEYGGGVFCGWEGSSTITNCTITGNRADHGGGVCCCIYDGNSTITNCILWGDSASEGSSHEIAVTSSDYPSTLTVSHSDVEGGEEGAYVESGCTLDWDESNIDSDPLFLDPALDDYHLSAGSPCIDAGDNAAVPPGVTTDLDGNPRNVDGDGDGSATVDMGAYEAGLIYDVTIQAYCYSCDAKGAPVSVSITMDGSPTGYDTPHTFPGLTGAHTFSVPDSCPDEYPFTEWNTGETSTTITVASAGTYIACYRSRAVPALTQWGILILVTLLVVTAWVVLRRRKAVVSRQ